MANVVKRSDRKAFYGVGTGGSVTYTRMEGFTDMSESKNPIEYSRKYVDMKQETSDVTGYSSSIGFTFDLLDPNAVLTDLAEIADGELTGAALDKEIVVVDFHKASGSGFEAYKRTYTVICDSVGGDEALQYSGTFKAKTPIVKGVATIATPTGGDADSVLTVTFEEEA